MRFWRRGNEDESAPETEAPEPRAERSWSNYADHFVVVIRGTDEWEREPFERAVVADFTEIGQELPLEEFVSELEAWLGARRGAAPFQIQIRRSYLSAGAAGVGAELVITFLGTAGGTVVGMAMYDALLAFVKERFAPAEASGTRVSLDWLRNEEPDDATRWLAGWVATALDRRGSELTLVSLDRGEDEIRAVYTSATAATRFASTRPATGSPGSTTTAAPRHEVFPPPRLRRLGARLLRAGGGRSAGTHLGGPCPAAPAGDLVASAGRQVAGGRGRD